MSGAHELEPLPSSSPEWARQVQQRLRRLEGPSRSVRAGDWVLVSKDGVLTANKAGVPPVTLASAPEDDPGSAPRSVSGLPAVMPEDWWSQLVASITGMPGTLEDLGHYLDAQYYASTHGPGALLAGANMLWNPDFTGIESLAGGDDWEWDSNVYYDSAGSGAAADQGSAKTVCDGARKVLRSNIVEVSEGQVLQLSARCAAFGLTGGGVTLGVAVYKADGSREEHVIDPDVVPADPTTQWYGLPAGAKATVVSGSWKVTTGVTAVRQYIDTSATAGTLWVDRGAFELGGLLSLLTRQVLWDDVGVLTRTVVTYVFGDGTIDPFSPEATAAMAAAFAQVLSDLGLTGPDQDMEQFWQSIWDGAIAQVVPKALLDIPGFFDALWELFRHLWSFLFGRPGASALGGTVAGELGDAWGALVAFLKPSGAATPTTSRAQIWTTLANQVLQLVGLPTIDVPSVLDPTIPRAPKMNWPIATPTTGASVPNNTCIYYVATVTVDGKESAPSNEGMVYIMPFTSAQVTVSWSQPPVGTVSLYRRFDNKGEYRRIATGLTATSITDTDGANAGTTDQPGETTQMALTGQVGGAIGQIVGADDDVSATAQQMGGVIGGTIPSAPLAGVATASSTSAVGVPEGYLYYRWTALNAAGDESVASGEVFVYISPAWLFGKAKVNTSVTASPGAVRYRVYRGTKSRAQDRYREVPGPSFMDDGTGTWTMAPTGPPSAPVRAAGAVAAVSVKANNAIFNAATADGKAVAADGKAVTANNKAQGVIDGIYQAVNGGTSTGNSVTGVMANLKEIPQSNIKINPAVGLPQTVAFDAASDGASTGSFGYTVGGTSVTWTHTVGSGANYLLVGVMYDGVLDANSDGEVKDAELTRIPWFTCTATPSGGGTAVPITLLVQRTATNTDLLLMGGLIAPGTYTIKVTGNIQSPNTADGFAAIAASYKNVNSAGVTPFNDYGVSSKPSLNFRQLADDPHARTVVLFGNRATNSTTVSLSAMTGGTQRVSRAFASTRGIAAAIGDAATSPSNTNFGMTAASTSGNMWSALEVVLEPYGEAIGSFGELQLVGGSTQTVTNTMLPINAFDTVVRITDDLTAPDLNRFKVTLAGSYWVRGSFWLGQDTFTASVGSLVPVCMVDDVMVDFGDQVLIAPSIYQFAPSFIQFSTVVYLKPGQSVWMTAQGKTVTDPTWSFVGASQGFTSMKIALVNRSLH